MAVSDVSQLNRKLGSIKGQVKKISTWFTSLSNEPSHNELDAKLATLKGLKIKLDDCDTLAISTLDDAPFDAYTQNAMEVFGDLEDLEAKLLHSSGTVQNLVSQQNNALNTQNYCVDKKVKLPEIPLPHFSGGYTDWFAFKSQFVMLIDENDQLSDAQKFYYLKSSLSGSAKTVQTTDDSYTSLFTALKDRFENTRLIVNEHISEILNYNKLQFESPNQLRNLIDTLLSHLRALKQLNLEPNQFGGMLLINIIVQKLDDESRRQYEMSLSSNGLPEFDTFLDFLLKRCQILENLQNSVTKLNDGYSKVKQVDFKSKGKPDEHVSNRHKPFDKCPKCFLGHKLHNCVKFKNMSLYDRKGFVKRNNLCYLCLSQHYLKDCKSNLKCAVCFLKHNTLLHEYVKTNSLTTNAAGENQNVSHVVQGQNTLPVATVLNSEKNDEVINLSSSFNEKGVCLLPTALVFGISSWGEKVNLVVLLDSGSMFTFISENAVRKLKLRRKNDRIVVNGIGNVATTQTRGSVSLVLESKQNDKKLEIDAFILNRLTSILPLKPINVNHVDFIKSIALADPNFSEPKEIDIILGSDYFFSVLQQGQIMGLANQPTAQNTIFGWVLAGKMKGVDNDVPICSNLASMHSDLNPVNLDLILQKFWHSEELPNKVSKNTEEENFCEEHFKSNVKINGNGHFVVKLPVFKEGNLSNCKPAAISRLIAMENKFKKNPEFGISYKQFLKEYEELGHMCQVKENLNIDKRKAHYLPHHAVIKSDSYTTKLRVVFDGSCKGPDGESLNSILGVGPTVQPDIFSILVKFRIPAIAFSADIQQMYRQIFVDEEDQNLQRIVWRESDKDKIKEYKLSTVTYGTSSAPFLATRCLYEIGLDCGTNEPDVASMIKNSFYIDDLMSGFTDVNTAIRNAKVLVDLLEARGFHLRKWRSNSSEFLAHIAGSVPVLDSLDILPDECSKALGLLWNSTDDCFIFKTSLKFKEEITKRIFLSESAKIFDPLGFLSPCTISIKIFYQQLWLLNLGWDDPFPPELAHKWSEFRHQFENLTEIKIPRWVGVGGTKIVLHGFSDASEAAYAAVVYVVQTGKKNCNSVSLLVSKAKVNPIKPISIPRSELNAALLLARLLDTVVKVLSDYQVTVHAWTDAQVVLAWLNSPPRTLKQYVANRTAEILEFVPFHRWGHVTSKENPADIASRGISPDQLPDFRLWWHGPEFLSKGEAEWPRKGNVIANNFDSDILERKKCSPCALSTVIVNNDIDDLFKKCSNLSKIVAIYAYCMRFISICKQKCAFKTNVLDMNASNISLNASERKNALQLIIKYVQQLHFHEEIESLKNNKCLKKNSSLVSLLPFIDPNGLLRVGGRLDNAQISYNSKHPIILPSKHSLSILLIQEFHVSHLHAGISVLSNIIRQNYWILQCKRLIKRVINKCVVCVRYKTDTSSQLMASLPRERVTYHRAFENCGLDFGGPLTLKFNKGRGNKTTKGYIALWVCFATKAYHIEAVSDLSSESFIAALRRFTARRGVPATMFSDNGSNFIGAKRKLSETNQILRYNQNNPEILDFLGKTNITWKMIPPSSPHFGGIWESGIRAVKFHIKRVVGGSLLTFEEISTLLSQIESILNSRPLVKTNENDLDSINVLTPQHFLSGDVATIIPDNIDSSRPSLLKRWDLIQYMKNIFWKRYYNEYLNTLQTRSKWIKTRVNFQVNDIVILKEDNVPPGRWPLGRIVAVCPGKDGHVRVVTVKTANGQFKRPIVKLRFLPTGQEGFLEDGQESFLEGGSM